LGEANVEPALTTVDLPFALLYAWVFMMILDLGYELLFLKFFKWILWHTSELRARALQKSFLPSVSVL
jgi:hypothetical protein